MKVYQAWATADWLPNVINLGLYVGEDEADARNAALNDPENATLVQKVVSVRVQRVMHAPII